MSCSAHTYTHTHTHSHARRATTVLHCVVPQLLQVYLRQLQRALSCLSLLNKPLLPIPRISAPPHTALRTTDGSVFLKLSPHTQKLPGGRGFPPPLYPRTSLSAWSTGAGPIFSEQMEFLLLVLSPVILPQEGLMNNWIVGNYLKKAPHQLILNPCKTKRLAPCNLFLSHSDF